MMSLLGCNPILSQRSVHIAPYLLIVTTFLENRAMYEPYFIYEERLKKLNCLLRVMG